MTRQEYVKKLIADGGYTSDQIYQMSQAVAEAPVKTNDPAVKAETNAGSTNDMVSESESGLSESPILPGTVITKGGYEYKFYVDDETGQGEYYRRPAGEDVTWTDLGKDESEAGMLDKASAAYHFGHSDMSPEKRKEYEEQIKAHEQYKKDKAAAIKKYNEDNKKGVLGILAGDDNKFFGNFGLGEGKEFTWDAFTKDISDMKFGESIARAGGEGVEFIIDAADFKISKLALEPIAGALNAMGILDLSDYEDDSWDGVSFDNVINNIVAEFVVGDPAYEGSYDFGEEVGDLVESGILNIGAGMMAVPKLLADTKKMIGDSIGEYLPPGAQAVLKSPLMRATMPGLSAMNDISQKGLVEAGEEGYNVFSKKAEQLNMTLADFGDVGMAEMMGDAFTGGDEGDYDMKKRLASFVAGSTRITASALGSLPSVAQSMIPYVGIASIVAGEAARTNMESAQDGRPLNWGRLAHAYTTGASEGLLELVTKKIGAGMFKGLRGGGKEAIEQSLRQYGTKVMKEFGQEGLSEVGTLLINQAADYIYKDEVDQFLPKWGEVIDTFLIGGVMGGGMSATGVGGQLIRNTISRKNIKGNLQKAGFSNLASMFESVNPFTEGGLSQEIGSGMEDSTTQITEPGQTNQGDLKIKDPKAPNQKTDQDTKKSLTQTEIKQTQETAQEQAAREAVLTERPNDIGQQNEAKTVTIKDGKPVSELTTDEKADAYYDVLMNPSTETFLNTDLKRKVESGQMTTTEADQIKANFKAQQGAANRMQNLGYSGEQRQKAIGLLAEKQNLENKIKDANDKSLTQPEQARIEEINSELSAIPRSADQQANIDAQVEKDIEFTQKFGNVGKKDGEFENAVGENKAVQVFETTQEFEQLAKDNGIDVDADVDGFVLPNGQIFLNKQKMREAGAIGVGRHELLHKVLKQQFSGPNGEKLKDEFLKILQESDPVGYALLMDKMKLYSEQELKDAPDEYLTNYASLLMENQIPLETFETKPSLIKRLGNFFSRIFSDAANENPVGQNVKPSDIGFESGKDLYDFVRGYVKDSEAGVLSDRAQQLAEQGAAQGVAVIDNLIEQNREIGNRILRSRNQKQLEARKKKIQDLDTQNSADELRTKLKNAKGENKQDIELALQEKFKNLPQAVKDAEIDIYTGEPLNKVKKSKTKADPLDAINDLIPADIKTKKQFDDFISDNRSALKIAQALDPGGVINNYIRSKQTSQEQGNKMLDEVRLRMFNFDPEAVRADGTVVGPKGFGESIFANTRFAKMVANKDLALEGETRKATKSIDSEGFVEPTTRKDKSKKDTKPKEKRKSQLPRSTTKFTTNFASNLGINVEGKTPKQLQEEIQKQFDKAIAKDLKANPVKTFGETRNIGPAVAALMEKATGMPAKVFTDKSQNIQKKDADSGALTAVKQYLYNNAQRDFNNLPDASDTATGKANFIPENIKRAFYKKDSKGKFILDKSKGLKDYQNLLGDMDKPVYRASEAQTIKGLVGLSLRNRIFEQAMPDPIARKTTGVKFSRTVDNNSLLKTLDNKNIKGAMKTLGVEDATVTSENRNKIQKSIKESVQKSKIPYDIFRRLGLGNFGAAYITENGKQYYILNKPINGKNKILKPKDKASQLALLKKYPGYFKPARGALYYGTSDPNYKAVEKIAIKNNDSYTKAELNNFKAQRISIPEGTRINKNTKLRNKKTIAEQEKINMKALMSFIDMLKGMPLRDAAILVRQSYAASSGLLKIAAPFLGVSERFIKATDPGSKQAKRNQPYIEEHSPPVSVVGAAILWGLKNGNLNKIKQGIQDNFIQVQLSNNADLKLDLAKLGDLLPKGVSILTPNAGLIRLAAAGINLNTIKDLDNPGKSLADKAGLPLPKELRSNPSAFNYQNRLLVDSGALEFDSNKDTFLDKPIMTIEQAKNDLKINRPVAVAKNNNVRKAKRKLNDQLFSDNQTAEQMKTVMVNSLETKVKASRSNPERKGISVFDFDDTLARTKERVIVNMPDGKIKEISASEFARDAGKLTEQGAEFDFSNFENVAKGTKEGPLAELARKRQGKFGSGDIFVLTARPNSAGPAIQAFLKSIGINIPLRNITGLSDGTPQAKVDFILNKTAEGYNDFYFADDSFANVKAVKQILDAVDVKNKVQQAKFSKSKRLNTEFNKIIEEVTGKESFKKYSDARARLEGKQKDGGLLKRIGKQFTITPSAEDFAGLTYALRGKGEQGNRHADWIEENLIRPYNKAEQALLSAKVRVSNDFAALKSKFPSLKRNFFSLKNPLLQKIGDGPFIKEQAVRVYIWNKQGMDIPGMSKRDIADLVKAVESDPELRQFAEELSLIQPTEAYPAPNKNWLGGNIKDDIINGMDTGFRTKLMAEFNENVEMIFTPENLNKLEAIFGTKYVEALKDSLRRMKSGSNRPIITGSGSRAVNEMLDWLNASVANVMFLNIKSGLLQTLSTVNFINWGDNNIINASKAFASKEMWPTFMRLMNSDYLVNRRDGLKINVNEAELADAAKQGGIKGAFSYLMDKGFVITRIMDSFAIALGGAPFFINRKKALLNRVNPKTGKLYTEAEADQQAFDDFYAVAEETQQSSNPSKISSQQASIAGRVLLAFQNVTMQFNRKTKKSILDLYNRRKKPGMTQRESDLSNFSSIIYYTTVQNFVFNAMQQALMGIFFEEEDEEERNRLANTANGMIDSLLFGLGFGGAIISTVKNVAMKVADEAEKKSPDYEEAVWEIFNVSPVLDSKIRKARSSAKTFMWNMDKIRRRGWSIENPAYLAIAQLIAASTNAPVDRVLQKYNNLSNVFDNEVRTYHRVMMLLGWNGWNFGLPYWGRQSTLDREQKEDEQLQVSYKEAVHKVKFAGFTKKIPLSGPNHYKPEGELNVDYMQVERPDGTIQYYVKPTNYKKKK